LIIISIIIIISVYFIFFSEGEKDTDPPIINSVTGNMTVFAGDLVEIYTNYTDNVNVTNATLFYKTESEENWNNKSITNGSVKILVKTTPIEDIYYYIIVDDKAGNGPVGSPSINGSKFYIITVNEKENNNNVSKINYVLIEEATATDCINCPKIADILYDLYETGSYEFYYLSLVYDKNTDAKNRLTNSYNVYGFPTSYIDGGYKVLVGSSHDKADFVEAILDSQERERPYVTINVTIEYLNETDEFKTDVYIENKENSNYEGILKLYLTEIISEIEGYDGKPYHFAFVDYILNENIDIDSSSAQNYSKTISASEYDYENVMVIGALYNSEGEKRYSDTSGNGNEFQAYFVDAVTGAKPVEDGNLPPEVGILNPEKGRIHLFGNPIFTNLAKRERTWLIGSTDLDIYANDDSAIQKIEIYFDGELKETLTSEPYKYTINKFDSIRHILRSRTIKVIAYDDTGKTAEAEIDVITVLL
jgi:hypothetical protein